MAYRFHFTSCFLFSVLQNDFALAQTLTTGKDFAFALPMMRQGADRITAYIHTSVKKEIKVFITTEGFNKGDGLKEEVAVNPGQSVPYSFSSPFYYKEGTGMKWCYRLRSTDFFGLTVLAQESQKSVASFLAIPIESWGKLYYAVTLGYNPFIQIIAGRYPALVRVRLLITAGEQTSNLNLVYQKEVIENLTEISLPLSRFQVFEISDCSKDVSHGSLTGTKITAQRPVGVLSGSCSSNSISACLGSNKATDLTAEMLLPRETFGKEFVTPTLTGKFDPGTYTFIPVKNNTVVHYLNPRGSLQQIRLSLEGEPKTQTLSKVYAWMKSIEAVQIFYTNLSTCTPQAAEDPGVITLVFLLPQHLYFHNYVMIVPTVLNAKHFVFLTLKRNSVDHMRLDGQRLTNPFFTVYKDVGAGSFLVSEGFHEILNENKVAFGCHLLGYGPGFAYSHSAGLMGIHINQDCEQMMEDMWPGDMIDNDCDGLVDEEIEDKKDNDKDMAIDEDLNSKEVPDNATAYFLEWEDWHCTGNCSDLRLIRNRKCFHPNPKKKHVCDGITVQYKMGVCYYGSLSCPEECPEYTWGTKCLLSCSNCESPCNKFYGTCPRCNPGFKDPQNGCRYRNSSRQVLCTVDLDQFKLYGSVMKLEINLQFTIACDKNKYGVNCTGNCEEKCGEDCWERVNGDCPSSQISVLVIMTLVLLIPCFNLLCSDKKKFDSI